MNDRDIMREIREDIPHEYFARASVAEVESIIEFYKRGKKHEMMYPSYDVRYMRLAKEIASWSKDPSTRIGSVAISKNNNIVLSQGYNGFPRGIKDDWRLYIRELKYRYVVHAELNMIYNAAVNGVSLKDSTVYIYGLPCCHNCGIALVQSGVSRVVMCSTKNDLNWDKSFETTKGIFAEAGIMYDFIDVGEI